MYRIDIFAEMMSGPARSGVDGNSHCWGCCSLCGNGGAAVVRAVKGEEKFWYTTNCARFWVSHNFVTDNVIGNRSLK